MTDADMASERYHSVPVEDHGLHIFEIRGEWEVWLNCEDADFTGLCLSIGLTRDAAVAQAVAVLEAVLEALQQPPKEER